MTLAEDFEFDAKAKEAADKYLSVARNLSERNFGPLLCFTTTNLFLWHIDAFEREGDVNGAFTEQFNKASHILETAKNSGIISKATSDIKSPRFGEHFEKDVSGLFSDIWVDMTDDIYFDETYDFTCERLEKNGINPKSFFENKIVVDCGCGSGKFSATIARLGAKEVIGVDIGEKGLEFARQQAQKVSYGERMRFVRGSLLSIPLEDNSVDMVWSNGVIHHTLDYDKCVEEFSRVTRQGGDLFLYVNGRFGLFELLQDTLRKSMENVPRNLMQTYLKTLGVNSGRLYWIMDCCYAPYEWRSKRQVVSLLEDNGYTKIKQLTRGVEIDQIEKISQGKPNAAISYGEGQLKFVATLEKSKLKNN